MFSQLGQLVLQVRAANRQKKPLSLLQDLVQLRLMLCQAGLQTLEDTDGKVSTFMTEVWEKVPLYACLVCTW